jgi:Cytochrome C'
MKSSKLSILGVCAIALFACKPVPQVAPVAKLPVSLNAVMATMVNHSADPIWIAAREVPKTEKEWRDLERHAYQLEVSGALLVIPGTGPLDEQWTQRAEWRAFANALSRAGAAAVIAVQNKDQTLINKSGDEIVEICESCHKQFKPDLPTMRLFGELSPHEENDGTAADKK